MSEPADAPGARLDRPIFLIGMMGAGKSTVGRMLAQALHRPFVDCDRVLESRNGVAIATIFELEGEAGFREREVQLLDELTQQRGIVLATGGGAVLDARNRRRLRERGLVIYLEASTDEIVRRTRNDVTRPLLQTDDAPARVQTLREVRAPLYRDTAHLTFRSVSGSPRRLANRILAHTALAELKPIDD